MTIKVIFDKHDGLITVTDRSKKWVISKDEAKSVFITSYESPKFITQSRVIYSIIAITSFGAITHVGNLVNKYYQVNVITKSGQELKLLTSSKKELADDLVKQILCFSTMSNAAVTNIAESNVAETGIAGYIKADKSPGKRSKMKPFYAGLIMICTSALVIIPLGLISGNASAEAFLAINFAGIVAIIAGVSAISKKMWWLSLVGTIGLIGVPIFFYIVSIKPPFNLADIMFALPLSAALLAGIIAVILLFISRKDFGKNYKRGVNPS